MKLYHGTNAEINKIDLSKSRFGKDFGVGFYLTTDLQVAKRQAERKFVQIGVGKPNVYTFDFDDSVSDDINILCFDSYSLEWAEFVIMNRTNKKRENVHNYDIVIGPIADDVIGFQMRRVEEGAITLPQFLEEIKYHTVTMQYMFATDKSLKLLKQL